MSKRAAFLFAKEQLVGCINSTLISPDKSDFSGREVLEGVRRPIALLFERFGQQGEKRHG